MITLEELIVGGRRLEGACLDNASRRAAAGLMDMGIVAGDRIAILMRNDTAQLVATLAAQHIGAYPVQVNWHSQPSEIHYVLSDSGARLLVAHADLAASLSAEELADMPVLVVDVPDDIRGAYRIADLPACQARNIENWDSWLNRFESVGDLGVSATESIIYTSGTSGNPKGVRRFAPDAELAKRAEQMRQTVFDIGAGSRVIVPAPLYHTAPLLFAMRGVRKGELLLLPTRFQAESFLADIERHRITHAYLVAPLFQRLLALPEDIKSRYDLSSLRFCLHAGGPCPPLLKRQMIDWWGPIIAEYYGSTETGPNTFCSGAEWLERPGTVGRPINGVELQICDDQGQPVVQGESGELWVNNTNYPDFTYLNRPEDRAALQRGDYIATGDVGYQDEDGYVFLRDRKRELVISGGVNIYPAEIERVLHEMPGVGDCAVFGIPDEEFGEGLCAVIQVVPGPDQIAVDDVRRFVEARLARFKIPQRIEIRESLPRDEAGKIRKRVLREPFWSDAGRKI
ncbi:AMP-binding protein [Pseudochelatococcus lubricantis]|uniref:AMP-binding protein n=1 Tax=Pseudochelatococcus lubricantis TaxID=1538102 RepID=UPI0035EFE0EB